MAVDDLYYVKFNASISSVPYSFGFYVKETSALTPVDDGGVVARACNAHFGTAYLACFSSGGRFESVQSWRRHPGPSRPGYVLRQASSGTRAGNPMPAGTALFINLRQTTQDAKYNGGIYLSGQSDTDHLDNEWVAAYLSTQVKAFTDLFPNVINAVGPDTGQFQVQVLSKTFVPASTPIGTPFQITSASATNRVMSQRRRTSKIRGYQLVTA